jgi:hypothetical protein
MTFSLRVQGTWRPRKVQAKKKARRVAGWWQGPKPLGVTCQESFLRNHPSNLGKGQGVEKPYIRTIGARQTQTLSLLGGLRFSYRYTLVEDDVRIFTRLERQSPSTKRRFVDYDED